MYIVIFRCKDDTILGMCLLLIKILIKPTSYTQCSLSTAGLQSQPLYANYANYHAMHFHVNHMEI